MVKPAERTGQTGSLRPVLRDACPARRHNVRQCHKLSGR
jgi:hypothetical protein